MRGLNHVQLLLLVKTQYSLIFLVHNESIQKTTKLQTIYEEVNGNSMCLTLNLHSFITSYFLILQGEGVQIK